MTRFFAGSESIVRIIVPKPTPAPRTSAARPPTALSMGRGCEYRMATPSSVSEVLRSDGRPLDTATMAYFEPRFGHDFSRVRVHTGAQAAASARDVSALAYTVGRDIVFGEGQYAPETTSGRSLLAHELTHVVQQAGTRGGPATATVLQRAPAEGESSGPSKYLEAAVDLIKQAADAPQAAAAELDALFMNAVRELIERIRAKPGTSIDKADEDLFRTFVGAMSPHHLKALEKELLLWPKGGSIQQMTTLIEIVTSFSRKTDREESERGRFEETEGGEVKARLSEASLKFGFNECLNFLHNASLAELFADEEEEVAAATAAYAAGAAERRKTTTRHSRTLSRLASELRLQGLLGPVNILRWVGRGEAAHHEPEPAVLFDRLSAAGDGWYFFLVNQISFHTFVIGVHVGGGKRRYFEIQGGQSVEKNRAQLKEFFDKEFTNTTGAYSRIWQVYLRPTE